MEVNLVDGRIIVNIRAGELVSRVKFKVNKATDIEWADFLERPGELELSVETILMYDNDKFIIDDVGQYGAVRSVVKIPTAKILPRLSAVIDEAINTGQI